MKRATIIMIAAGVVSVLLVSGAYARKPTPKAQGKELVKKIWADMRGERFSELEKMMSPGFQSVHADGARHRDEQIKLLIHLKMGKVSIKDIEVTEVGPMLIATYTVAVEETIEGKRLSKKLGAGPGAVRALRRKGVLVRHYPGAGLRDALRVTVGTEKQIDRFLKALDAVSH